ncbi:MAG: hypothetical protein P8K11_05730 [Gammaproteobacteria bacterium]|nr:hypothetical protein [Gammaproteobacteria bacterium]
MKKRIFSRMIQWCLDHPRSFSTMIVIGGIGDTVFYYWFSGE